MNRIAGRAGIALVLALLLIAGTAFFVVEYAINAENWVVFAGSPHLYYGTNLGCGVVTDRSGGLLMDLRGGRQYSPDLQIRMSTLHWLGDRNGSIFAPALSHYASSLAGFDMVNGVYSYGITSGEAKLTLSAQVQKAALEALGDRKGTVGVYNYKTGQILCAVTTPTYDPDNIPDIEGDTTGAYKGAYLNRFIQSSYIPGSIFKIVTLAAALETIPDIQEQTFYCEGYYTIDGEDITCEGEHKTQTLQQAFQNSCNSAFAQIAEQLGSETLQHYADQFGITQPVTFDGITTVSGNFEAETAYGVNLGWCAIGQYTDQINPCRYMTFMGAIAADGMGVMPYLVDEISVGNTKTYSSETQTDNRIMSAETAKQLQTYMKNTMEYLYGTERFSGLPVCAKTGTGQVGGDQKPNAMLSGFVADEQYPLAFIIAVENGGYGGQVCSPILDKVLESCKAVMDAE